MKKLAIDARLNPHGDRSFVVRAAALFSVLSAFSACSPLPRQAQALAGSQTCCKEIAEFKFQEVTAGKTIEASITTASQAYAFPEGKSYFAAFQLPASDADREMVLKTHLTGLLVPD